MHRYLLLVCGWLLLLACQPANNNEQAPISSSRTDSPGQAPPAAKQKPQAELPTQATRAAAVPFSQPPALDLPSLTTLCQNKYGCLRETIYPLGWSAEGKFAYLLERTNEAVSDYTLDTYVLDASTNSPIDSLRFQASQRADYTEATDQFNFAIVWELQEKAIRKLVEEHDIVFASGTTLSSLDELDLRIQVEDKTQTSMYTGKEVLAQHVLRLPTDEASRVLRTQTYGKYDLILATELLGAFRSPDGRHHALLEGQEQRGFEGPPNILKLYVIGF